MNIIFKLTLMLLSMAGWLEAKVSGEQPTVLLAILAKNKAHVLPTFLKSIDHLDYNKKLITVYINTNNNQDATKEILDDWVTKNGSQYRSVIMDSHNVPNDDITRPHEWTFTRIKVLANIRNKSLQKTKEHKCDFYFVVDCDNFIAPYTLTTLIKKDKPIIAPLLRSIPEQGDTCSNYFCDITDDGYFKAHPDFLQIYYQMKVGTFDVPVVHCTYLIKSDVLDKLNYIDGTDDYEFVIFSRMARKNNISQYICNEKDFGTFLHFYTDISLEEEVKRFSAITPAHEGEVWSWRHILESQMKKFAESKPKGI